MTVLVFGWAWMMGNKRLYEVTSRDWLYPLVDIKITGKVVEEENCEPDANISCE